MLIIAKPAAKALVIPIELILVAMVALKENLVEDGLIFGVSLLYLEITISKW
jgi:hypothetical protein